jgi:hypothetical protein
MAAYSLPNHLPAERRRSDMAFMLRERGTSMPAPFAVFHREIRLRIGYDAVRVLGGWTLLTNPAGIRQAIKEGWESENRPLDYAEQAS